LRNNELTWISPNKLTEVVYIARRAACQMGAMAALFVPTISEIVLVLCAAAATSQGEPEITLVVY
jgi:hypothetical protein